jgi:hypothetical protein
MRNGLEILVSVVDELLADGFDAAVFGGWAEELLELQPPREHKDIDLLIIDPEVAALDRFVASRNEIELKRFSHKRAYVQSGILIELFVVRTRDNRRTTLFFDTLTRVANDRSGPPLGITGCFRCGGHGVSPRLRSCRTRSTASLITDTRLVLCSITPSVETRQHQAST